MKAVGPLNGNWRFRGYVDKELEPTGFEVSDQRKMELSIETAIGMTRQDYPGMAERGKANLDELIPRYVKAFGHLGLIKFGYFNG